MFNALAERRDVIDRPKLVSIVESVGLDQTAFAAALDACAQQVTQDMTDAERRGIQGAPVLFLNQQRVDGLRSEDMYTDILDDELKSAPAVQATLTTPAN